MDNLIYGQNTNYIYFQDFFNSSQNSSLAVDSSLLDLSAAAKSFDAKLEPEGMDNLKYVDITPIFSSVRSMCKAVHGNIWTERSFFPSVLSMYEVVHVFVKGIT